MPSRSNQLHRIKLQKLGIQLVNPFPPQNRLTSQKRLPSYLPFDVLGAVCPFNLTISGEVGAFARIDDGDEVSHFESGVLNFVGEIDDYLSFRRSMVSSSISLWCTLLKAFFGENRFWG